MSMLSLAAVLALAGQCAPEIDSNLIAGIARHESGAIVDGQMVFNPAAIHANTNGSVDRGLMQINSANLAWLGLTEQTAFDPCRSIAAAARLLHSINIYNTGSSWRGLAPCNGPHPPAGCGYTMGTIAAIQQVKGMPGLPVGPPGSAPKRPVAPPTLQDQLTAFTTKGADVSYR